MKKKWIMGCLAALFCFASISLIYVWVQEVPKEENPMQREASGVTYFDIAGTQSVPEDIAGDSSNYSGEIAGFNSQKDPTVVYSEAATVVAMDEVLSIKSINPRNYDAAPSADAALLGWEGTVNFTVTRARLYPSFEDAQISDAALGTPRDGSPKYILLDVTIENVSATNIGDSPSAFSAGFWLETDIEFAKGNENTGFHRTNTNNTLDYFSLHGNGETDYYSFMLPEGNTKTAQLGFYVEEAVYHDRTLILNFGDNQKKQFGIALNEIEEMG